MDRSKLNTKGIEYKGEIMEGVFTNGEKCFLIWERKIKDKSREHLERMVPAMKDVAEDNNSYGWRLVVMNDKGHKVDFYKHKEHKVIKI